jgi:YVTN family beta-propeller protein
MRRILVGAVLSIAALAAAPRAAAKESSLVPPAESTRESRQDDIQTCLSQARAEVSSSKPLDDDAILLLQGHHTEGFIREGHPVVNRDHVPTPNASLFVGRSGLYGPSDLSDRYVVCLMKRGYKWPEKSDSPPVSVRVPPHDTESATKPIDNPDITKITLGHYPQGIAFSPGAIWVAYDDEKKNEDTGVFRVDANTNQTVTVVRTGKSACAAAAGEGAVWIGNLWDNSVTRIDPETNRVVATVAVGKYPFGLDVGEGSVWVTNAGSNSVSRIDPRTNAVVSTIMVGKRPAGIAVGGGFVWVANSKSKSVSRIDPGTNAVVATIEVHGEPVTLTAHGTDLWVSSQSRDEFSVLRIDAKSNSVVTETPIGTRGKVGGTTLLGSMLWVADRKNGALWRMDTQTNRVVGGPIPVGYDATIVGVGTDANGTIWLSNSSSGTVRKVKP